MSEPEKSILAIVELYKAAVFTKDLNALIKLYDTDVRIFDLWSEWSCDGLGSWTKSVNAWFTSLATERDSVEFAEIKIFATEKMAVLHAFITFRGLSAEGEERRSIDERLTWTLVEKTASWKIVHQHTSVPIELENLKARLKRSTM